MSYGWLVGFLIATYSQSTTTTTKISVKKKLEENVRLAYCMKFLFYRILPVSRNSALGIHTIRINVLAMMLRNDDIHLKYGIFSSRNSYTSDSKRMKTAFPFSALDQT